VVTTNGKGKSAGDKASKKSDSVPNTKKKSKVPSKSKTGRDMKLKQEDGKSVGSSGVNKNRKKVVVSKTKSRGKEELRRKTRKRKSEYNSIADLVASAEKSQKENRKEVLLTTRHVFKERLFNCLLLFQIDLGNPICSACLGSKSDGSNEVVECDSCGISVHEGREVSIKYFQI